MSRLSPGYLNSSSFLRLRTALGSNPADETTPAEVTKYDWRSPRYFNEDQRNRLAAVMSQVAASIGTGFAHSFNREVTVSPTSIAQHFAGRLRDLGLADGRYYLTFAAGKDKGWGFLSITAETALRWVKRLLGDSGSDADTSRALSSLEESLLIDLAAAAMDAFLSPLRAHEELRAGDRLLKDNPQAQFEPAQEICMIVFAVTGSESQEKDEVLFVLPCSLLAPLAGKSRKAIQPTPPDELSRMLMEHVQQMPITITARLGHTALRFEELLELGRDDILLLDRLLDEAIELLVDGRVVFRGRVAQSDGQRAVVITQSPGTGGQKTAKAVAN
jgi:flagellar motor switch protein FliN/FliY